MRLPGQIGEQLRHLGLFAALVLTLLAPLAAGEKTDQLRLANGNLITGEIKKLDHGILSYKTDSMSTVSVEWTEVRRLTSAQVLQIELSTGQRFYGSLGESTADGKLRVEGAYEGLEMNMTDVVIIEPIEDTFWQQLDGSLSLGFSYTKGTDLAQLTFNSTTRHRAQKHSTDLTLASIMTRKSDDENSSSRHDANIEHIRYLKKKWFARVGVGANQNDELGIDLRLLTFGGAGRHIIQTNHTSLSWTSGLSLNREFVNAGDDSSNIEAVISGRYAIYRYNSPKTDLTTNLSVFPSLTTWGRYRVEFDTALRKELITDFFWELNLYYSFDSEPPSVTGSSEDYGIVTSFGWSF